MLEQNISLLQFYTVYLKDYNNMSEKSKHEKLLGYNSNMYNELSFSKLQMF